jgi:fructose-1-phosphate kinase PfkB-like protein
VVVSLGGGALVLVEEEQAHSAMLRVIGVVLIGAGGVMAAAIVANHDKRQRT